MPVVPEDFFNELSDWIEIEILRNKKHDPETGGLVDDHEANTPLIIIQSAISEMKKSSYRLEKVCGQLIILADNLSDILTDEDRAEALRISLRNLNQTYYPVKEHKRYYENLTIERTEAEDDFRKAVSSGQGIAELSQYFIDADDEFDLNEEQRAKFNLLRSTLKDPCDEKDLIALKDLRLSSAAWLVENQYLADPLNPSKQPDAKLPKTALIKTLEAVRIISMERVPSNEHDVRTQFYSLARELEKFQIKTPEQKQREENLLRTKLDREEDASYLVAQFNKAVDPEGEFEEEFGVTPSQFIANLAQSFARTETPFNDLIVGWNEIKPNFNYIHKVFSAKPLSRNPA